MVLILMMSAKMATPGLLKTMVINPVHDVTNKTSSHDSNYILEILELPKFGNSSTSMKVYKDLASKNSFFGGGGVLVQAQQFGTGTRYRLEYLHQWFKRVKSKSKRVLVANFYICRSLFFTIYIYIYINYHTFIVFTLINHCSIVLA